MYSAPVLAGMVTSPCTPRIGRKLTANRQIFDGISTSCVLPHGTKKAPLPSTLSIAPHTQGVKMTPHGAMPSAFDSFCSTQYFTPHASKRLEPSVTRVLPPAPRAKNIATAGNSRQNGTQNAVKLHEFSTHLALALLAGRQPCRQRGQQARDKLHHVRTGSRAAASAPYLHTHGRSTTRSKDT